MDARKSMSLSVSGEDTKQDAVSRVLVNIHRITRYYIEAKVCEWLILGCAIAAALKGLVRFYSY